MSREIKSPPAKIMESKSFDGKHLIQFNEESHRYKLFVNGATKGFQAVGTTTYTKSGYPTSMGLMIWMKSQTAEALFSSMTVPGEKGFLPREIFPITEDAKKLLIKSAKEADKATSQEAADIGTICHGYAELHSLGKIAEADALLEMVKGVEAWPLIESCVRKYKEWAATNRGELVMAEGLTAYVCPLHRGLADIGDDECTCFCGKFDRLDRVNGKLRLRDYKTSKDIFLEQFIQLGGYRPAIKTWYNLDVQELEVLRFGKDDGTFETMLISDPKEVEEFQKQALRCRRTYNFRKLENDPRWAWKGAKTSAV